MIDQRIDRRGWIAISALAFLAGCTIVPKTTGPQAPATPAPGPDAPRADVLPSDDARHRIALLVPLTGPNAQVGQSIANAATMALLDTNAQNLRVTTYDTAGGAGAAATRAIADENKLILGPLLSGNIPAIAAVARPANVPLISFSNDESAAARDVFVMGNIPGQSVSRVVRYARGRGLNSFAAVVPLGDYGKTASDALMATVRSNGGSVAAMETYDRSQASVTGAARKLAQTGGYDAVLIADGGRMSSLSAPVLKPRGAATPQLLGTELWSGEKVISSTPSLRGAWFAAPSDDRFGQFSTSYRSRFAGQPFRIATLGYDAVLLSLRVARDWRPGTRFPVASLIDSGGFLGLDGAFRFGRDGVIERALEVREVTDGGVRVVSPAPARFDN